MTVRTQTRTAQVELAERIALQQTWLAAASVIASARAAGRLDLASYRSEIAILHEQGASVRFLAAATGRPVATTGDDVRAGRLR